MNNALYNQIIKPSFLLIFVVSIALSGCSKTNSTQTKEKRIIKNEGQYLCEVNTDCSIKTTECGCCAVASSCVNTNWTPKCPEINCESFSCQSPPTPPWFDNCQCIDNTCTNCRGDKCETLTPR